MTSFDGELWGPGMEIVLRDALARLSQDIASLIDVEAGLQDAMIASRHADLLSDLRGVIDVDAGLAAIIAPGNDNAPAASSAEASSDELSAPRLRISIAELGQLRFLADGASSKIFAAPELRLPGSASAMVYKEFTSDRVNRARSASLAVAFRAELSPEERRELDRFSVWPRAVVEDSSGGGCGLLMPLVPAEYFIQRPDLGARYVTGRLRDMDALAGGSRQSKAGDVDFQDPDLTDRLFLLAHMVYALGWLHKHGWVFGDLSFRDAAFALEPPRLMLLGCDSAAPLADLHRRQVSTPGWEPPECSSAAVSSQQPGMRLQDEATDVYKLGLAILRCLAPSHDTATAASVGHLGRELDQDGVDLISRALSADRSRRPAARDLYRYLRRAASLRAAVPEIALAKLITPFVVDGSDALIEWMIKGATSVTVSVGDQQDILVDFAANPRGYAFQPHESGSVSIEAYNRFGTVSTHLGDVRLYELPSLTVSLGQIPRPQVTVVEPGSAEPVIAALATMKDQ